MQDMTMIDVGTAVQGILNLCAGGPLERAAHPDFRLILLPSDHPSSTERNCGP